VWTKVPFVAFRATGEQGEANADKITPSQKINIVEVDIRVVD